jgi:hypothetical protein
MPFVQPASPPRRLPTADPAAPPRPPPPAVTGFAAVPCPRDWFPPAVPAPPASPFRHTPATGAPAPPGAPRLRLRRLDALRTAGVPAPSPPHSRPRRPAAPPAARRLRDLDPSSSAHPVAPRRACPLAPSSPPRSPLRVVTEGLAPVWSGDGVRATVRTNYHNGSWSPNLMSLLIRCIGRSPPASRSTSSVSGRTFRRPKISPCVIFACLQPLLIGHWVVKVTP